MLASFAVLLGWLRLQRMVEERANQLLSHLSASRWGSLRTGSARRAFQVSPEMGAFAGLGMGLNGVLTAFIELWPVPLLLR